MLRGTKEKAIMESLCRGLLIPPVTMADRSQLRLFTALGENRSPFGNVADWPDLHDYMRQKSLAYQQDHGEPHWKAAGGCYGDDGEPSFTPSSSAAVALLGDLACDPGGFLWTDPEGIGWAVRVIPGNEPSRTVFHGFAITWLGTGKMFDPVARQRYHEQLEVERAKVQQADNATHRLELQKLSRQLWLFERAERCLWWIHFAVLVQRRSMVLIPDVILGQAIWGSDRNNWPSNWRQNVMSVLKSLSFLHAAELRMGRGSWHPRFDSTSVCLTHVRDLESRPREDICRAGCPLWNVADAPDHHHYHITIGHGFLGVLENYFQDADGHGVRRYNFKDEPKGEAAKRLRVAREAGQVVSVFLPAKLGRVAPGVELGKQAGQIIQALVREVTRKRSQGDDDHGYRAAIQVGNLVPDGRCKDQLDCPLLDAEGRYVVFGGNGRRAGCGYRIVGAKGTGWLYRCGYPILSQRSRRMKVVGGFLRDLKNLVQPLGLIVAGLEPKTNIWLTLDDILQLAGNRSQWDRLDEVNLRIYAGEGCLEQWAKLFDTPGTEQEVQAIAATEPIRTDLATRMRQAKLRQKDLADHLAVTPSFVTQVFTGSRAWPAGMEERAEAWVVDQQTELKEEAAVVC